VLERATEINLDTEERTLALDDLLSARGVMLTSALRCAPVVAVDGRPLSSADGLLQLGRLGLVADGLSAAVS
jgi:branched-subunit amino acid aminotransferase/4-amino-4-deoxychorismate lyase